MAVRRRRRVSETLVRAVGELMAILREMEEANPAVLRGFLRVMGGATYRDAAKGLRITGQGLALAVNRHCRHHTELQAMLKTRRRPGRSHVVLDDRISSSDLPAGDGEGAESSD